MQSSFQPQLKLGLFHIQSGISNLPGSLSQVQHSTWLGEGQAVPSGHNTAMGECLGVLSAELIFAAVCYASSSGDQSSAGLCCGIVRNHLTPN